MMDVAAHAGVSQATVSLVLNGSEGARFSDATRKKVQDAADAIGYRLAHRPANSTPSDRKIIGFIVDEITTDPWMALAFEGAREKALEFGITTTLVVAGSLEASEDDLFSMFPKPSLLGYIYGTMLTRRVEVPAQLLESNSILLNCYDHRRKLPSVVPGDLVGGRTATERLIKAGRKRIALINGQDGIDASSDRLRGYKQALSSNDISFDVELVRHGNWELSSGYKETHALMRIDPRPDAIFCANDMMALGCIEALRELGVGVPTDVSVIGFDNRDIAQFIRPGLTTLVLPQYEMGILAAEMLIDMAGGLNVRHDQIKVECTLIERESV